MKSFRRGRKILKCVVDTNRNNYNNQCGSLRFYANSSGNGNDTYGTETILAQDKHKGHQFSDKQKQERSQIPKEATVVKYHRHGDPLQVLQIEKEPLPAVGPDQTLVQILMAPIHWMDINQIQGQYPVSSSPETLPAVPGSECLASVLSSSNSSFTPGDHVIPLVPSLGTWRSHAVFPTSSLLKVPQNIKPEYSSSLLISPCSALRLLNDYPPPSGSTILVNSCSSLVSQTLVQLAAKKGLKVIAVVRDRPNYSNLSERLKANGATIVFKEEDFTRGKAFWEKILEERFDKITVAYDGSGGRSAREMVRWLDEGGKMVVFGGMSRKGVSLSAGDLIWGGKSIEGFWMENFRKKEGRKGMENMVREMWKEIQGGENERGKLRFYVERWMFKDIKKAVGRVMAVDGEGEGEGVPRSRDRKVVLVMKGHEFVNRELDDDVIESQ